MSAPTNSLAAAEARVDHRSNMYLGAVLACPGSSLPVKVRNMSSTGALLEAAVLPETGTSVRLVRGQLVAAGEVVWRSDGRCGERFASPVYVGEWLAPPSNQQQRRIDEAVRLLKAGAVPLSPGSDRDEPMTSVQLGHDLKAVGRILEAHCEHVSDDDFVATASELQSLDIGLQMLAAVSEILSCNSRDPRLWARVQNLRVSCAEVLK